MATYQKLNTIKCIKFHVTLIYDSNKYETHISRMVQIFGKMHFLTKNFYVLLLRMIGCFSLSYYNNILRQLQPCNVSMPSSCVRSWLTTRSVTPVLSWPRLTAKHI